MEYGLLYHYQVLEILKEIYFHAQSFANIRIEEKNEKIRNFIFVTIILTIILGIIVNLISGFLF